MSTPVSENLFAGREAIIFDFDGTIADTFTLHETAFQQALKDYPLEFSYSDYTGMSTGRAIRMIFEANDQHPGEEDLNVLVARKRQLANQLYQSYIRFMPGAREFIVAAHDRGLKLFIGSSGSAMNIGTGVEALGIGHYFSGVITADDVTRAKPDPEIFQLILQRYSIDPSTALVIEDAPSGIRAAAAAGIDVICVDPFTDLDNGYPVMVCKAGFGELINLIGHAR